MTCEEARKLIPFYLAGNSRQIEPHLAECELCRRELEEMREADRLVARVAPRMVAPAQGFTRRALARIDRRSRLFRVLKVTGLAAAAVTLAFSSFVLYVNLYEPAAINVTVSGAKELIPGSTAVLRVLCTDTAHRGISAALRVLWGGREIGRAQSDAAGIALVSMKIPDVPDGAYRLEVIADTSAGSDSMSIPVVARRPYRVMISTDKPLYQPLQTVRIRLAAMDSFSLKPAQSKVEIVVANPDGTKILQKELATSEFGIASCDLPLPDELIFGRYRIEATLGGVTSDRVFEVKRYVLPKFKVEVKLDKPYYRPTERVRGSVTARYFFGKPVEGATVKVGALEGKTDERGAWEFNLPAGERFEATVLDSAGHVETGSAQAVVSDETLRIHAIPYGGKFLDARSNEIFLICTSPDGVPAPAELRIEGQTIRTDEMGVARHRTSRSLLTVSAGDRSFEIDLRRHLSADDVVLHADRVRVKAGQSAGFTILSTRTEGTAYVDVVKLGQTILTRPVELRGGRAQLSIDLPAELSGTIEVRAHLFGGAAAPVRDRRVLFVDRPDDLKVDVRPSRDLYAPGEPMKVEIQVRDAQDRPVRAATGISVVDAAVLAIADRYPGMEKSFFQVDESLTRPRWSFDTGVLAGSPWGMTSDAARARISNIAPPPDEAPLIVRAFTQRLEEARRRARTVNGMAINIAMTLGLMVAIGLAGLALKLAWDTLLSHPAIFLACGFFCALIGYASIPAALILFAFLMVILGFSLRHAPRPRTTFSPVVAALLFVPILGVALIFALSSTHDVAYRSFSPAGRADEVLASRGLLESSAPPTPSRPVSPMEEAMPTPAPKPVPPSEQAPAPRVREYFPETLYWNPQAITDEGGRAVLELPAADSITTWKLLCSAVSRSGGMGSAERDLVVFQEFFADLDLPVTLTEGDRIRIPVMLYNYLDAPQKIQVALDGDDWFEAESVRESVELRPREIRSVAFNIRARRHGWQKLSATATGSRASDALVREIEVLPQGRPVETALSDRFRGSVRRTIEIPPGAAAPSLWVRLFPSTFAEIVTGLERLVRLPYG
jgi:hypothetical protein